MGLLLSNADLYLDGRLKIEHGSIYCEDGIIVEIADHDIREKYPQAQQLDLTGQVVLPGFIDTHIHGAENHDAIDGRQETIDAISHNVVKDGCTAFLASLTVISHTEMLKVLRHYKMVRQPQNGALFLGIHEEGPYLSVEYKALMDERYLRDPSSSELDEMLEACGHRIITMTVAPERHGMDQFIPYLKKRNISVMIGHSAATSGDVQRALNNQADGFTHLYNACSQHLHRDPGVVTGAFLDDRSYCELICDGFHVHEDIIKMSYKYLTSRRIVLITDAMLGKGMPDGEFIFSNLLCQKEGTHVWVKATGRRAGSAFGMIDAVRFMLKTVNCTLNDIVQMACVNPAVLAKVADKKGRLAVGMDADICVMDQKQQILHTIIGSRIVYSRD